MENTLEEMLLCMNQEKIVYLGAKSSSGFMAIDYPQEILSYLWYIDELSLDALRRNIDSECKMLVKAKENIAFTSSVILNAKKREITTPSRLGTPDDGKWNESMGQHTKRINDTTSTLIKNCNSLVNWVHMKDRKVLKSYAQEERDGQTIIVEGTGAGGFWFKEEFDDVKDKYKKGGLVE